MPTIPPPRRRRSFAPPPVRVVAHVDPAIHDRLVALRDRHGVSLSAVLGSAIAAGLPEVERWPGPGERPPDPEQD